MTNDTTLARLRAANPVAAASGRRSRPLFDRIVSLPPRPARRPVTAEPADARARRGCVRRRDRRLDRVRPHPLGVRGSRPRPGLASGVQRAQTILELPPGYTWPAIEFRADTVMVRGGGGSMAVSIDQSAWECYWVGAIERGDAAAATRAHGVLDDLMTKPDRHRSDGRTRELGTDGRAVPVARLRRRRRLPVQAAHHAEAAAGTRRDSSRAAARTGRDGRRGRSRHAGARHREVRSCTNARL